MVGRLVVGELVVGWWWVGWCLVARRMGVEMLVVGG